MRELPRRANPYTMRDIPGRDYPHSAYYAPEIRASGVLVRAGSLMTGGVIRRECATDRERRGTIKKSCCARTFFSLDDSDVLAAGAS